MRTHAKKFSSGVGVERGIRTGTRTVGLIAALLLVALPGTAAAAPLPPTISSQFTPASIGAGGTTALSFTITNPNSSGTLSAIGFTDTLPTGLAVDNPNGQNGTCGSTSTLSAPASGSTITLTTGKLAAGATCTVQVSVTSTTPGTYQNSTGPVSDTVAGAGNTDTQSLTVFGLPTVSITAPTENAVFAFGQQVIAQYSCQDAPGAPGIAACSGDADSGTAIDTSTVGAQTFSVSAISADGAVTTQTIDYTVLPDNRITVGKPAGHADGTVTFRVRVPDVGKLTATLTHSGTTYGQLVVKQTTQGSSRYELKLNAKGRKLLRKAAKAKHPKPVAFKLTVTFLPAFGKVGTPATSAVTIKP